MNCGHLFNGIGGFALAAHWMGWNNVMHCEIDPFCNKVMNHHFPNSYQHEDIRATDFTIWRGTIELLTGGDPCQPSSRAGKRKGKTDDRYLWPEYKRAIIEICPKVLVNENVLGTIENGILDEKISDLETLGYSWWPPLIIPASAVGADHKRDRVWLVAHLDSFGMEGRSKESVLWQQDVSKRQVSQPFQEARERFPSFESRLCRTFYGIPKGAHRLKALGNAIVPQVAFQLFNAIEKYATSAA